MPTLQYFTAICHEPSRSSEQERGGGAHFAWALLACMFLRRFADASVSFPLSVIGKVSSGRSQIPDVTLSGHPDRAVCERPTPFTRV